MSDVMERYKIPGWKVRTRAFVMAEGESVQVRLNLVVPDSLDKPVIVHEHTQNVDKE